MKEYDSTTRHVLLNNSRRLWYWTGFTISACALNGMSNDQAKLSLEIPEIIIANVIELIPCSKKSIENIKNYPVYRINN